MKLRYRCLKIHTWSCAHKGRPINSECANVSAVKPALITRKKEENLDQPRKEQEESQWFVRFVQSVAVETVRKNYSPGSEGKGREG